MYSAYFSSNFVFTRIRCHNLTKIAHAFLYYGHTMYGTVYDLHGIILYYGLFMTCILRYTSVELLWLPCFHRSPYMTFYDFHVFCMVVNLTVVTCAIISIWYYQIIWTIFLVFLFWGLSKWNFLIELSVQNFKKKDWGLRMLENLL